MYLQEYERIKFKDGISELKHINKGVRQGCGLSPVLFNTHINKIILRCAVNITLKKTHLLVRYTILAKNQQICEYRHTYSWMTITQLIKMDKMNDEYT